MKLPSRYHIRRVLPLLGVILIGLAASSTLLFAFIGSNLNISLNPFKKAVMEGEMPGQREKPIYPGSPDSNDREKPDRNDKPDLPKFSGVEKCSEGLSTQACFCTTTNCYWNDSSGVGHSATRGDFYNYGYLTVLDPENDISELAGNGTQIDYPKQMTAVEITQMLITGEIVNGQQALLLNPHYYDNPLPIEEINELILRGKITIGATTSEQEAAFGICQALNPSYSADDFKTAIGKLETLPHDPFPFHQYPEEIRDDVEKAYHAYEKCLRDGYDEKVCEHYLNSDVDGLLDEWKRKQQLEFIESLPEAIQNNARHALNVLNQCLEDGGDPVACQNTYDSYINDLLEKENKKNQLAINQLYEDLREIDESLQELPGLNNSKSVEEIYGECAAGGNSHALCMSKVNNYINLAIAQSRQFIRMNPSDTPLVPLTHHGPGGTAYIKDPMRQTLSDIGDYITSLTESIGLTSDPITTPVAGRGPGGVDPKLYEEENAWCKAHPLECLREGANVAMLVAGPVVVGLTVGPAILPALKTTISGAISSINTTTELVMTAKSLTGVGAAIYLGIGEYTIANLTANLSNPVTQILNAMSFDNMVQSGVNPGSALLSTALNIGSAQMLSMGLNSLFINLNTIAPTAHSAAFVQIVDLVDNLDDTLTMVMCGYGDPEACQETAINMAIGPGDMFEIPTSILNIALSPLNLSIPTGIKPGTVNINNYPVDLNPKNPASVPTSSMSNPSVPGGNIPNQANFTGLNEFQVIPGVADVTNNIPASSITGQTYSNEEAINNVKKDYESLKEEIDLNDKTLDQPKLLSKFTEVILNTKLKALNYEVDTTVSKDGNIWILNQNQIKSFVANFTNLNRITNLFTPLAGFNTLKIGYIPTIQNLTINSDYADLDYALELINNFEQSVAFLGFDTVIGPFITSDEEIKFWKSIEYQFYTDNDSGLIFAYKKIIPNSLTVATMYPDFFGTPTVDQSVPTGDQATTEVKITIEDTKTVQNNLALDNSINSPYTPIENSNETMTVYLVVKKHEPDQVHMAEGFKNGDLKLDDISDITNPTEYLENIYNNQKENFNSIQKEISDRLRESGMDPTNFIEEYGWEQALLAVHSDITYGMDSDPFLSLTTSTNEAFNEASRIGGYVLVAEIPKNRLIRVRDNISPEWGYYIAPSPNEVVLIGALDPSLIRGSVKAIPSASVIISTLHRNTLLNLINSIKLPNILNLTSRLFTNIVTTIKNTITPISQSLNRSVTPSNDNELTQSEKSTFDKLAKDTKQPDNTREAIGNKIFFPKKAVAIDGKRFYLTDVFNLDNGYKQALMYTKMDNGEYHLRLLWKSKSNGFWRVSPYFIFGHQYYKGNHYTQETLIVSDLSSVLDQSEIVDFNDNSLKIPFNLSEEAIDKYESEIEIFDDKGLLEQFKKYQPGSYSKTDVYPTGKIFSEFSYPEGFIPNFSKGPIKIEKTQHTLLGEVILKTYQGRLDGKLVNWVMAYDSHNRIWIHSIYFTDSKVNSFGIRDVVINSGALTNKPLDYFDQTLNLLKSDYTKFDATYSDITPLLSHIKPIEEFKKYHNLGINDEFSTSNKLAPENVPADTSNPPKSVFDQFTTSLFKQIESINNSLANTFRTIPNLVNNTRSGISNILNNRSQESDGRRKDIAINDIEKTVTENVNRAVNEGIDKKLADLKGHELKSDNETIQNGISYLKNEASKVYIKHPIYGEALRLLKENKVFENTSEEDLISIATSIRDSILGKRNETIGQLVNMDTIRAISTPNKISPDITFVGDVHGDHLTFINLTAGKLTTYKGERLSSPLLSPSGNWIGGENEMLIITGDLFDRAPQGFSSTMTAEYVMNLQKKAGRMKDGTPHVLVLLGNHEVNAIYALKKGTYNTGLTPGLSENDFNLLKQKPSLIKWIQNLPAMYIKDDILVMHSDTVNYLKYGKTVKDANNNIGSILKQSGNLDQTYQLMNDLTRGRDQLGRNNVNRLLSTYGGNQIIHGHSRNKATQDKRVTNVDWSLSRFYRQPTPYGRGAFTIKLGKTKVSLEFNRLSYKTTEISSDQGEKPISPLIQFVNNTVQKIKKVSISTTKILLTLLATTSIAVCSFSAFAINQISHDALVQRHVSTPIAGIVQSVIQKESQILNPISTPSDIQENLIENYDNETPVIQPLSPTEAIKELPKTQITPQEEKIVQPLPSRQTTITSNYENSGRIIHSKSARIDQIALVVFAESANGTDPEWAQELFAWSVINRAYTTEVEQYYTGALGVLIKNVLYESSSRESIEDQSIRITNILLAVDENGILVDSSGYPITKSNRNPVACKSQCQRFNNTLRIVQETYRAYQNGEPDPTGGSIYFSKQSKLDRKGISFDTPQELQAWLIENSQGLSSYYVSEPFEQMYWVSSTDEIKSTGKYQILYFGSNQCVSSAVCR